MGDLVHKGLVGKALDAVPMDADERVALQRTSSVVSGTLTGRSLSVWAGLTNPILLDLIGVSVRFPGKISSSGDLHTAKKLH